MNAVSWGLVTVSLIHQKAIDVYAVGAQLLSCRLHPCRQIVRADRELSSGDRSGPYLRMRQ
jgi:hypothetical protein